MKQCAVCGGDIPEDRGKGNKSTVRYCSTECGKSAYRGGNKPLSKQWGVSTSAVGAVGELVVCTDLLKKGYEVFRAVAPCGCDIVATKGESFYRIEVKTGYMNVDGKVVSSFIGSRTQVFDVLAIVLPDRIDYSKDL